jgi:hypothetical protein
MNFDTATACLVLGMMLMFLADFVSQVIRRRIATRRARRFNEAKHLLKMHGLTAHMYLPGAGIDDLKLREALSVCADRGYLVTDSDGSIVGKFATSPTRPALRT